MRRARRVEVRLLLADSDGDGLDDGLELGLTTPEVSEKDPEATDLLRFSPDADPESRTDPSEDSDGDGLSDGIEDANQNGATSPTETHPQIYDTDNDGMDDGWERKYSVPDLCDPDLLRYLDPLDSRDGNKTSMEMD